MSFLKEDNHSVVIELFQYENPKFDTFSTTLPPDLTIIFKSLTISLHKSVLIERCPYFKKMLESDYKESETNRVNIEFDIDAYIFYGILEYIRTGKIVLSTENLESVYRAACYFMLNDLAQICFYLFRQNIDYETVDYIHTFGKDRLIPELNKAAMDFKENYFEAICKSRVFLKWRIESIEELLCSDLIKVKNEKIVLMFVFEWLQFDLEKRFDGTTELFLKLRYFYLSKPNMEEIARSNNTLGQILSKIASELCGKSTPPRVYYEGIYTFAYREDDESTDIFKFNRYSPTDESFRTLQLPASYTATPHDRTVYVCSNKIYMITKLVHGEEPENTWSLNVQVYDPLIDTWTSRASTIYYERINSVSCALEDNIYIIDKRGHDYSSSVYCVATNTWNPLEIPFEYYMVNTATACGDSIYLLSSVEGAIRKDIIQFKPSTQEFTRIPWNGNFQDFEGIQVMVYKSKLIFFPLGDDDIPSDDDSYINNRLILFDIMTKDFEEYRVSQGIDLVFDCQTAVFNDSIYIVKGTEDDETKETYDVEMKKLKFDFMDDKKYAISIPQPNWKPFTGGHSSENAWYAFITGIE